MAPRNVDDRGTGIAGRTEMPAAERGGTAGQLELGAVELGLAAGVVQGGQVEPFGFLVRVGSHGLVRRPARPGTRLGRDPAGRGGGPVVGEDAGSLS